MKEISRSFFEREPVVCARELIGCVMKWGDCMARIVETEAYAEFDDEACHAWSRPSARHFIQTHPPGTAYVYLNYGVHWLFNILAKSEKGCGFVLFRALEPLAGIGEMKARRGKLKDGDLCSGPGKLTVAMGIGPEIHGVDVFALPDVRWFHGSARVVEGTRIGISRAMEHPWRFMERESKWISRPFR